jgi:hypothetical protein
VHHQEWLDWTGDVEKALGLPPLRFRGRQTSKNYARSDRAATLVDVLELFRGGMKASARAALRRAAKRRPEWLSDGKGWRQPTVLTTVRRLASEDKVFWLRLTSQADNKSWVWFFPYLRDTATNHKFRKNELLPLVASADPQLRMLGLNLMAGTKTTRT